MTGANAILILTGIFAAVIIFLKIRRSLGDLRVLFTWRGLAANVATVAAVFSIAAFYGTGRHGPIFPKSPFRYFAWIISLILFLFAIWIELSPSTQAWLRRNRTGVFKLIRVAHHKHD